MKTLVLRTALSESIIHIGKDLLSPLSIDVGDSGENVLIADDGLPTSLIDHVASAVAPTDIIRLRASESKKTLSTYRKIVTFLSDRSYSPNMRIIALGGGIVIDVAGFVAATYARGVRFISIPTTLLAMADAAVGGKTGLNIRGRKNVIGAFYQADDVWIDSIFIQTLPDVERAGGFAEIIKTSLVGDASLFSKMRDENPPLEDLITASLAVKISIVERDPFDRNIRRVLNYGHTIGHALEAYHKGRYGHGQCVAAGMEHMAHRQPFADELSGLFAKYAVDTNIPYDPDALFKFIAYDKKRRKDTIDIAFVEEIGNGFVKNIRLEDIKSFLKGGR